MAKKEKVKIIDCNSIPKEVELFGRKVKTIHDPEGMNIDSSYGQARYGCNEIAITDKLKGMTIPPDENKMTYLHEMCHFILNFTGFEALIKKEKKIDIEQFVELLASAIYQYEKSAKY